MDISQTLTLQLRSIIRDNAITVEQLHDAILQSDESKNAPAIRTLKSYISTSKSAKNQNPTIKTLHAIANGFNFLGIDVNASQLIGGHDTVLSGQYLLEAVKCLAISQNQTSDRELIMFFEIFNSFDVDEILKLTRFLSESPLIETINKDK